jgi:hypothetical protein
MARGLGLSITLDAAASPLHRLVRWVSFLLWEPFQQPFSDEIMSLAIRVITLRHEIVKLGPVFDRSLKRGQAVNQRNPVFL